MMLTPFSSRVCVFSVLAVAGLAQDPGTCVPRPVLQAFRHDIAFKRSYGAEDFRGFSAIHAAVWIVGDTVALYAREHPPASVAGLKLVYLFNAGQLAGGFSCAASDEVRSCLAKGMNLDVERIPERPVCQILIKLSNLAPWAPSPLSHEKIELIDQIRAEIQKQWDGATGIVIRNFNIQDNQLFMDLEYGKRHFYMGCGFSARFTPHCTGWHLFGDVSNARIAAIIDQFPLRIAGAGPPDAR